MRPLNRTLLYALGCLAPGAGAMALPPPPYAAEPTQNAPQAFDRYGGGARASAPDAAPSAPVRVLAWSDKTEAFAAQRPEMVSAIQAPPAQADPPAPPMRRASVAAGPGQGPRFYSVHRAYGMEPDPIPLPPQFFGPTADVTQPTTPPLRRSAQRPGAADQGAGQDASQGAVQAPDQGPGQ